MDHELLLKVMSSENKFLLANKNLGYRDKIYHGFILSLMNLARIRKLAHFSMPKSLELRNFFKPNGWS